MRAQQAWAMPARPGNDFGDRRVQEDTKLNRTRESGVAAKTCGRSP